MGKIREKGASGGGGGGPPMSKKLSDVSKSAKKPKKFLKKRPSKDEALDFDEEENGGVNQQEISDFVSKLGLNKFNIQSLNEDGEDSPRKSPSKNSKKQKKLQGTPPPPSSQQDTPKSKSAKKFAEQKKNGSLAPPPQEAGAAINTRPVDRKKKNANQKAKLQEKRRQAHKNNQGEGDGTTSKRPQQHKMVVKNDGGKWFQNDTDDKADEPHKSEEPTDNKPLRKDEFFECQKTANNLLNADISTYISVNNSGSNKSDFKWTDKMMKSGTLPDRMAAFVVRIQDSPIHNLQYLQQLISMVKVQGKQQCMMTADTLRDLFLEDLLPPDRKLQTFSSRSAQLRDASKKELITWMFEERLKNHYVSYIEALKKMAGDTVEKLRGKAIAIMHQLLASHPEQEETLLQVLVNKLGDPHKKLGSRALFYLSKLLDEHPRMKMVVVEEVERLIFRNNISKRAQYYGICFLNIVGLKDEHASLAHKLITIYLAFFKASVKTGDIDTKMMSGLLTGINRAFPQAREFGFQFTENLDTLYKIVQLSQFTISVQALCILFQITDVVTNPEGADRFYRVLYEKLLTPEFQTSAHNVQFLNLVFRSMKSDKNSNRVTAFMKRLLQISQSSSPNMACAVLFLLSEVTKVHPQSLKIGNMSDNETKIEEEGEEVELSDSEDDEKKAAAASRKSDFGKLLKSSNITVNDETGNGKENSKPKKPSTNITSPIKAQSLCESKEPELISTTTPDPTLTETKPDVEEIDVKPDIKRIITEYNPIARNPAFCGAELTLSYELIALAKHFHPSVALFAQTLLKKKGIKYDGDPMRDFTLTRFLERFSYRNAKANKTSKYTPYQPKGLRSVPVNSESYLQTEEESIPVEERFFYRFFKTKKEKSEDTEDVVKDEDDSDAESVGDDEFDDLMKNYFKSTGGLASEDEDSEEEEETGVDYASGFVAKGKGKKRKAQDDDDEESDEEEEGDDSEGDDDADEFISMDNEDDDFEESDDELGLDDDESFASRGKGKKRGSGENMFAPAEEFADMLEDNAEEGFAGSQTLVNKDRSDPKQLKWEVAKDRWMKGFGKNSKPNFKNAKKFKPRRK